MTHFIAIGYERQLFGTSILETGHSIFDREYSFFGRSRISVRKHFKTSVWRGFCLITNQEITRKNL